MTQPPLAKRWLQLVLAADVRRWRIAEALARNSVFSPVDVRRLLVWCSDDVDQARRVVRTATERRHTLADAYFLVTELGRRRQLGKG